MGAKSSFPHLVRAHILARSWKNHPGTVHVAGGRVRPSHTLMPSRMTPPILGAALVAWAFARLARGRFVRRSFADGSLWSESDGHGEDGKTGQHRAETGVMGHDGKGNALNDFGWKYIDSLSADENYMDLVSALARNSVCTCGHMGCVLVKDGKIIARSVNTPLFSADKSDVHAEVNAIAQCAAAGVSTMGACAYITMPPCKNCYTVLQAAKITRIVSRQDNPTERVVTNALEQGIEMVTIWDNDESLQRRAKQIDSAGVDRERVEELRRERKKAKQESKAERQRRREAGGGESENKS